MGDANLLPDPQRSALASVLVSAQASRPTVGATDGARPGHNIAPMPTPPASVDIVREFPDTSWADDSPTHAASSGRREDGMVLSFPQLPFVLDEAERRFLDPRWADGRRRRTSRSMGSGTPGRRIARRARRRRRSGGSLKAMIVRYAQPERSIRAASVTLPHPSAARQYIVPPGQRRRARNELAQDDTRLHIDVSVQPDVRDTVAARVLQRQSNGEARRWRDPAGSSNT